MSEKKALVKSFFATIGYLTLITLLITFINWAFENNPMLTVVGFVGVVLFCLMWLLLFVHYVTK